MTYFDDKLSQRSKDVLPRLEEWKFYPNLLAWYLQCYPVPQSRNCHLLGRVFAHGRIDLIGKEMGKCKGQTKKVISLWWDQFLIQLTGQK